jgi:hypothetical protein
VSGADTLAHPETVTPAALKLARAASVCSAWLTTTDPIPLLPLRVALRHAPPRAFPRVWVERSLLGEDTDQLFGRARRLGLHALSVSQRRGRLPTLTGAVAESVAALVMDSVGFNVFAQLTETGARGADLLLLGPTGNVLALEVKGTLRPALLPRLGRSRLKQMSRAWLDGPNPPMLEWGLAAADVFGGVIVVDLALNETRLAVSRDSESFTPVTDFTRLDELLHTSRALPTSE